MTFKILILFIGIFHLGWSPLVWASTKPVTNQDSLIIRTNITDNHCLECHGIKGYAIPLGAHGDTPKKTLDVNIDNLRASVHGKLTCLQCHTDIQQLPHSKDGLSPVDCIHCHQQLQRESTELIEEIKRGRAMAGLIPSFTPTPSAVQQFTQDYTHSIHAQPRQDNPQQPNADCQACHGTHYVFPAADSRALSHRLASPEVCGQCHTKALAEYRGSVHGAALNTPWKGESAVCSDCHTAHQISATEGLSARRVITEQCGNCHADALSSYMDSYHGQLAWLGGEKVAKCYDCHEAHDTRKIADPAAKVNPTHLLKTCQECHKNATTSFIQFHPHANTRDFDKYPALWLVAKGMVALVIIVLIFFYSHSLLWFYRSWQTRKINHPHQVPLPANIDPHQHFQRFSWPWRVNHWLLALSVMTLVFTGMTVMYADSFWAIKTVIILGGPENAATIHRIAAVIFLTAILGHLLALFYKLILRRRQGNFAWFGPNSLLPRYQDVTDMIGQYRWFFGKGEPPRFDRWTYWEKFDYWAVYWGALVIGISGLLLWWSEFFGQYLPGWVFNIATVAHGVEAFLAVTTLFVVHFFNNHFRPGKFPLDTVMFVGSWRLEELREERPAEYDRLVTTNQLAQYLVPPPSKLANIISHILGFTLIGIGLFLLVLVVAGLLQQGLV